MPPQWTQTIREQLDDELERFFQRKRASADALSPRAGALLEGVADLTRRGGKRLRPMVVYAGYRGVQPRGQVADTLKVGAAMELLQTYLLVHDDWMDGDEERRGGPSLHARFAAAHDDRQLGNSLAVLAGDLACSFAWELLGHAPFPTEKREDAHRAFARIGEEVIFGQQLDLLADPDVARMHDLKTGSYTVRGPLTLGALLGGGNQAQVEALVRFGEPMGLAFQIRDDLLGTFGDTGTTGKPAGNDLRRGKHTSLIHEARRLLDTEDRQRLESVLGREDASDDEIAAATDLLQRCGARARVEERLEALLAEARQRLEVPALQGGDGSALRDLVALLGVRDR